MLGVHSLAPATLYTGTTTTKKTPKTQPDTMAETKPVVQADGDAPVSDNGAGPVQETPTPAQEEPSGDNVEVASADATTQPESNQVPIITNQPEVGPSEPQPPVQPESGSSEPQIPPSRSSIQQEPAEMIASAPAPGGDRTTPANAIAYRRDPETVIGYLVPLPKPTIQGTVLDVPPKYFLYAPPPPHLVKPSQGSEGYAIKLTRHWQQNVRKAKSNAHNGKRLSLTGIHSKMVRSCVWGLDRLKYDDVAFLARIHPKTVNHLILIHPGDVAGVQTPEEILSVFRAQIFESKKRAKRDSIISATLFLPALAIDTAAVFFGGLAEIDGIWMLVSITAYRTAKAITQKMGSDPKTLEMTPDKLLQDVQNVKPQPKGQESDEEAEPGALRRSMDALRRGMGTVKHRMSQRGGRKKKENGASGSDEPSTDTIPPPPPPPPAAAAEEFQGGELEHHVQEEAPAVGEGETPAVAGPSSEGAAAAAVPQPSGGILQDPQQETRTTSEDSGTANGSKSPGKEFQLTFCPSPGMDILARYLQETCHLRNGQAFQSPAQVATVADVLAMMGWHPEKREHESPEQQKEDELWQAREIEDDLRIVAAKAAKSWDKACHKYAKNSRRPERPGKKIGLAGRFRVRRPTLDKGKVKASSTPADSGGISAAEPNKETRQAIIKRRVAAIREKVSRKQGKPEDGTEESSKAGKAGKVGKAAVLFVPFIALGEHVRQQKKKLASGTTADGEAKEKSTKREALKQRLGTMPGNGRVKQLLDARKKSGKKAGAEGQDAGPSDAVNETSVAVPTVQVQPPTDTADGTTAVAPTAEVQAPTDTADAATTVAAVAPAAEVQAPTDTATATTVPEPTAVREAEDPAPGTDTSENAEKSQNSKKARLIALPVATIAAIKEIIKKRLPAKKPATETQGGDSSAEGKKSSRLSALKEHIKTLRTKVTKERGVAKTKAKRTVRGLKKKTKAKLNRYTKTGAEEGQEGEEEGPKGVKTPSAMVGLVAGYLALPATKVKEVRDRRRKDNNESSTKGEGSAATGQGVPVAGEVQGTTTTSNGPVLPIITTTSDPTTPEQHLFSLPPVPIPEEDEEEDLEEAVAAAGDEASSQGHDDSTTRQSLPGHGQSEIPVASERQSQPETAPGIETTSETTTTTTTPAAVGQAPAVPVEPVVVSEDVPPPGTSENETATPATAVASTTTKSKFESFRNGIGGLATRKRGAAAAAKEAASPGQEDVAVAAAAAATPEGVVKEESASVPGGRLRAVIKDGIGNMRTKKSGGEDEVTKPSKDKVYKDKSSGFVERMKAMWYVA